MRGPSIPVIDKTNPKAWRITWNHNVPPVLWDKYAPRRRIRIRVKDNINRYEGEKREAYAAERLEVWTYMLFKLNYDPFEEELAEWARLKQEENQLTGQIAADEKKLQKKNELTPIQKRGLTPVGKALDLFMESRLSNTANTSTHATWRTVVKWIRKYFDAQELLDMPVTDISRMHMAEAISEAKKDGKWSNSTFNNNKSNAMSFLNWLAMEEFIPYNPAKGKIKKLKAKKKKHRWYDPPTKAKVKAKLIELDVMPVYRAMEFVYWIMIRSQAELFKLKFEDIDRTLKRVRFSDDLSKNNTEQYRDYEPEFDLVLDAINFNAWQKDWYIFGRHGVPSPHKAGKNTLSDLFRPVRTELKLPDVYTIYGMKHTRIIHLMMKGVEGLEISYMARHNDTKTTEDYKRDYDISLKKQYKPEDLTF